MEGRSDLFINPLLDTCTQRDNRTRRSDHLDHAITQDCWAIGKMIEL